MNSEAGYKKGQKNPTFACYHHKKMFLGSTVCIAYLIFLMKLLLFYGHAYFMGKH